MKDIKDLKITTAEGLSVKNYKRFPSSEWGEEGGMQADLYLKGVHVGTVYDAGDGGESNFYGSAKEYDVEALKTASFNFLSRKDKDWNKYKFMPKQASAMRPEYYALVVDLIACYYNGKARTI